MLATCDLIRWLFQAGSMVLWLQYSPMVTQFPHLSPLWLTVYACQATSYEYLSAGLTNQGSRVSYNVGECYGVGAV